jgi:hypothetical protein
MVQNSQTVIRKLIDAATCIAAATLTDPSLIQAQHLMVWGERGDAGLPEARCAAESANEQQR